ncbi:AbrB/MazE/SpoVT family DNA-binding domain-containing protein [Candidatus Pacearchaeota archaeon]|nr:AbrB/MazE/SpoVT family DNA-binding domain-containing protein [Candidatus Pacearchaeota archaeon]
MDIKIIKVTDKGQISLPIGMRQSLGINQGDDLIVTRANDSVIIKKVKKDDFRDLLKHSESVAKKLWDNEEDEVWNDV